MKKNAMYLLFLGILACFCSCSSMVSYTGAQTQPDQAIPYFIHGQSALRSVADDAWVNAKLTRLNRSLTLSLNIGNSSDTTFDVFPGLIKVTGFDAKGNAKAFKVFTADEFLRRRRKNATIALVATGAVLAAATVATVNANNGGSAVNNDAYNSGYFYVGDTDNGNNYDYFSPTPVDGLARENTLFEGMYMYGDVKIKGDPLFMKKILVEVPVHERMHKLVFEARGR